MSNAVYWWLYWWEDDPNFYEYFDRSIQACYKAGLWDKMITLCQVVAIKQLRDKKKKEFANPASSLRHLGESNSKLSGVGNKVILSPDRNIPSVRLAV